MRDRLIEILKKSGASFERALPEEIADYLLAEGVIVLPCKLNSKVYDISEFVDECPCPDMYEFSTEDILLSQCRTTKEIIFGIGGINYTFDEFGKRVFASETEAEKQACNLIAERSENGT